MSPFFDRIFEPRGLKSAILGLVLGRDLGALNESPAQRRVNVADSRRWRRQP